MNTPVADIPSVLSGQDSHVAALAQDNRPPYFSAQPLDARDEVMLEESEDRELQRMARLTRGRDALELRMCELLDGGTLTVAETLDCLRELNRAIDRIRKQLKPASPAEDMSRRAVAFVKTLCQPKTEEPASGPRLEGTTPHGREIVRRRLYGLKKRMMERQEVRADCATALSPTPA
jgi:hypothetical protein